MTEAAKCCQRPLPLIRQQPQIYLLQPIHFLQPPTQFLPVRSMVPHSKNEGDRVRVSNLHLIHWKKMAVFVYSSLCSLISEKLFLSERNVFAANRLDSQGFYCSFIFCRVPSLQHLWWPLSGHVQFPVSLPFALYLLQMLPINFQMGFLYNILGCGERLQKAANTWQCDPFRVKFNFFFLELSWISFLHHLVLFAMCHLLVM